MTLQRFNGEKAYAVECATMEHAQDEDDLRVRAPLLGTTTDVNFYDGSKPDTKVIVEADLTRQI